MAGTTSASPLLPERVPPPSAWALGTMRGPPGVAVPERCRYRAPLVSAEVPATTHFVADPRTLGVLVLAETQGSPLSVARSGAVAFDALGHGSPGVWVPWPDARSAPRLARTGDQWIAAWDAPAGGGASQVLLYRGGEVEKLGTGDAYVAADLACGASRCALLTSRSARVAAAGASVVVIDPAARSPLQTRVIEPEGESLARPFGLASVEGDRAPVAVLTDAREAVFWGAEGDGGSAVIARVPAEHGVLDATLLGDKPIVIAHGNVVDEQGCAREGIDASGAKLLVARPGVPPIEIRTPGAPSLAALRPLARGALLVWLAPLGCGSERHVVFGVVLDASGAPASAPLPIGDGDTFTLASSGADADLWLRRADRVLWMRLTCDGP
jgi:hypothetical protein